MSNINLNVVGAETFGARLPTVFIEKIEIEADPEGSYETSAIIKAYLTLKFTKPPHMQLESTSDFIRNQMKNLVLYAYITGDDTSYAMALEDGNLDLLEWHNYVESLDFFGDIASTISWFKSLPDIVDDSASVLELNNSFDGEGNEIIQISNIVTTFQYVGRPPDSSPLHPSYFDPINTVEKLFFFGTVGLDMTKINNNEITSVGFGESPAPGVLAGEAKSVSSQTYNSFFGNITYYHILQKGEVANPFYRQYSLPDGSPYLEEVLQSINGKFYSTSNYGYVDIKDRLTATFNQFSTDRSTDPTLDKNISDLEAIILAENNRTNMLGEMATYRSTYPNKDQATASGRFYNSFIIAYSEILVNVQAQDELSQKLYLDSLVTDLRAGQRLLGTYVQPSPASMGFSRGTSEESSNDFLAKNWFQISRNTLLVQDISSAEFSGDSYYTLSDSEDAEDKIANTTKTEFEVLLTQYYEEYLSLGWDEDIAYELAQASVISMASGRTAVDFDIIDTAASSYGDIADLRDGDAGVVTPADLQDINFIVRNNGYFFFDFEKALRTQTILSWALNLSKMQQHFRWKIPYNAFYLNTVSISRTELYVGLAGTSDTSKDSINCGIYADFELPAGNPNAGKFFSLGSYLHTTPDIPRQYSTGLSWVPESNSNIDDIDYYKMKYLRPIANTADGTEYTSYLKIKNFDVATGNPADRLQFHNLLSAASTYDSLGPVMDGYRLMCFEFSDLMDDDVAYYNATDEGLTDDRKEKLENLNNIEAESTVYRLKVTATDNTKDFYSDFYDYIESVYNEYYEYAEMSAEICSFNNITNSYNTFFIDAINEKYEALASSTSADKPWVKAAYVFTALSDILFKAETISKDDFDAEVLKTLVKIAPSTGNLGSTLQHLEIFETMFNMLRYDAEEDTPGHVVNAGWGGSDRGEMTFHNQIEFGIENYGPIYGDFIPDFVGIDDTFMVAGEPRIVIPNFAFMGGRTDDISGTSDGYESDTSDALLSDGTSINQIYAGVVGETAERTFSRTAIGTGELTARGDSWMVYGFLLEDGTYDYGEVVTYGATAWVGIFDIDSEQLVRIAYDEIFLPYSKGDWRWQALRLYQSMAGTQAYNGPGSSPVDATWLKGRPSIDKIMDGITYSLAGKWAHEILQRSTTDVKLNATATQGKRKGTNNMPSGRRDYRTLGELQFLLSIYMQEAERRKNDEEAAKTRYSYIVRGRQNAEGAESAFEYGDMREGDRSTHGAIYDTLSTMFDAINDEFNRVFTDPDASPSATRDATLGNHDLDWHGMADVVSSENYPGLHHSKLYNTGGGEYELHYAEMYADKAMVLEDE